MNNLSEINRGFLSYSGLSVWSECPYKFKLKYIDKIKLDSGSIYTHFGGCMHKVLEECFVLPFDSDKFKQEAQAIWADKFWGEWKDDYIDSKFRLDGSAKQQFYNQGIAIIHGILINIDEIFHKKFGDYQIVTKEKEVVDDICGINMKGIIDIIIKDNNENMYVVDYKSAGSLKKWNKINNEKIYQKMIYERLASNMMNQKVKSYFLIIPRINPNEGVRWVENTLEDCKLDLWLQSIKFGIENQIMYKNKGSSSCFLCEYNQTQHCP